MPHRKRFRLPVISRLTWAWLSASAVLTTLGGVFLYAALSQEGAGRIALPVDDMEYTARLAKNDATESKERPETPPEGLRLAAPGLRDESAAGGPALDIDGEEARDMLVYPDDYDSFASGGEELAPEDFVITIDGQPQSATPVITAALNPVPYAKPIPDPTPALLRTTPLGKVPRIGADGRTALHVYAKPFDGDRAKSKVALIVGGLGLNNALTERAIDELPPEISLSFAPYAKDLEYWTNKARRAGHEILIELPMEGYGPNQDALGAAALLSTRSAQENLQRLDWLMSRFGGYFAATNYMGAKFSTQDAAIAPILAKLSEAGVGYIDDTGAAPRAAPPSAAIATVNRMIPPAPNDQGRRAVRRELKALEQHALSNGAALGKTYAYAATLDEIIAWANALDDKDIVAAPASTLLHSRIATR